MNRMSYEEVIRILGNENLPVHVKYSEKDNLKRFGIKWNPKLKMWFVAKDKTHYPEIKKRLSRFDTSCIHPELVPASSWGNNLRDILSKEDWRAISKDVCSHGVCMNCGGRGSALKQDLTHALEAHEEWSYDKESRVQTLTKIVSLCPDCHLVRHIGYASALGIEYGVKLHMMQYRHINSQEADEIISNAFSEFEERSKIDWILDITNLSNYISTDNRLEFMTRNFEKGGV